MGHHLVDGLSKQMILPPGNIAKRCVVDGIEGPGGFGDLVMTGTTP